MSIEESKRLTNMVDFELNNFIKLNQNGCRENLARNLTKARKDNIFWPIKAETEPKQKAGD